jgi:hypothetical protein
MVQNGRSLRITHPPGVASRSNLLGREALAGRVREWDWNETGIRDQRQPDTTGKAGERTWLARPRVCQVV